jgi:hypothetical protein
VLQISRSVLLPTQGLPLQSGLGESQERILFRKPVSQEAEHSDHSDQDAHFPSNGQQPAKQILISSIVSLHAGDSKIIFLVLVELPDPHDTEQGDHLDHSVYLHGHVLMQGFVSYEESLHPIPFPCCIIERIRYCLPSSLQSPLHSDHSDQFSHSHLAKIE